MTKPIGVYVHIPFCKKRCAYCDFYSVIINKETVSNYITALKKEIYRWGEKLCRPADTVYFGGGTPSELTAEELCELLNCIKTAFKLNKETEITVEVNPENVDYQYFKKLKEGGFNRISMGVQTMSDNTLKILGRRHSASDAVNAFNMARKAGFANINLDIMLGLPNQSVLKTQETVKNVLSLSPEHISCYMLILEEKTALFARRNVLLIPDEEQTSAEYEAVCDILKEGGYNHYEISNFAKDGKESKHNLKYWNSEEYIGIGPSAYSFLDNQRFHYENNMHKFLKSGDVLFDGEGGDFFEYLMLSLRLKKGISEEKIKSRYFKKFSNKFKEQAKALCDTGFAVFENGNFSFTEKGMLVSNSLICDMTEEDMYEDL